MHPPAIELSPTKENYPSHRALSFVRYEERSLGNSDVPTIITMIDDRLCVAQRGSETTGRFPDVARCQENVHWARLAANIYDEASDHRLHDRRGERKHVYSWIKVACLSLTMCPVATRFDRDPFEPVAHRAARSQRNYVTEDH